MSGWVPGAVTVSLHEGMVPLALKEVGARYLTGSRWHSCRPSQRKQIIQTHCNLGSAQAQDGIGLGRPDGGSYWKRDLAASTSH